MSGGEVHWRYICTVWMIGVLWLSGSALSQPSSQPEQDIQLILSRMSLNDKLGELSLVCIP